VKHLEHKKKPTEAACYWPQLHAFRADDERLSTFMGPKKILCYSSLVRFPIFWLDRLNLYQSSSKDRSLIGRNAMKTQVCISSF